MRTFVDTLRSHLDAFGAPSDNETTWKILRQLQILIFDFSAEQGQSESLVRDRCVQALDPSEQHKAGALWAALCDIAQTVATSGGEIASATLRDKLRNLYGFKLAGLRQNRAARARLAEASRYALRDIRLVVGNSSLSRRARLHQVYASLDQGRYVEILGDGGVGKSGVLRALAEQIAMQSNIIVLSPTRTIPRGWLALRQSIGFDGTAYELLSDIAASGGATLFLDSVDFFNDGERATANDLVREAASIPGFNVIVTARRSFGTDELNWLDPDALDALGRAPVVMLDELSDSEIQELRSSSPELAPLLTDGHPARDVVRNLFRLDRLIQQGLGLVVPRTEAAMSRLWWQTGDGRNDSQIRDRRRILHGLADQCLPGRPGPLDISIFTASALDALVKSGSLRDLGSERAVFRHDVFRDWGVANLLHEDSARISILPLSRPAPATLFRGVELAARLAIEESSDAESWKKLLNTFSQGSVHGSWRRAVLIALVRSEASGEILTRAATELLVNSGRLLREVVRTLMALEVTPATKLFAGINVALPEMAGVSVPTGPAWRRLIVWLLTLKDRLPPKIIPDVAELYTNYASAAWAVDPIVPELVTYLHAWLMEMEGAAVGSPSGRACLGTGVDHEKRHAVRDYLRSSLLILSHVKPDLADEYVRFLLGDIGARRHSAESVIVSPGNLPKAAPQALAELTGAVLIEPPTRRRGLSNYHAPEAFTHADGKFLSPSPARGPFFELLMHAPKIGQKLIRQLVFHACTFGRRPKAKKKDDEIIVDFDSGQKSFPYIRSYYWSRGANGQYCVTSALMALEAWGQQRIDAGESVEAVIADILGDDRVPAAYLLVAVDLVLSHWPKSRQAAIPFVGCPELLAWDRERQGHDMMGTHRAMFGEKEPRSSVNRESLEKRGSRQTILERTLPLYALYEPKADGDAVRTRLEKAAKRLKPYEPDSDFADPRFMVRYALNQLDHRNWQAQTVKDETGKERTGNAYVAPKAEVDHLAPLQEEVSVKTSEANLRAELMLAVDDPQRSSTELVERSITWARAIDARGDVQPDFDHSVLISAMLLMRDGNAAQLAEHRTWAIAQFQIAIARPEDSIHRFRDDLKFNPTGIAACGMVHAARHDGGLVAAQPLINLAARGDPAVAHGLAAAMTTLTAIDPRLPKGLLRVAFTASSRPRLNLHDSNQGDAVRRKQIEKWRAQAAGAEWRWLQGQGGEPAWPDFPEETVSVREHLVIADPPVRHRRAPKPKAKYYADHQAAGVWLIKFAGSELVAPEWVRPVAVQYRDWTAQLNGSGLDPETELSRSPDRWNDAYYRVVARSLSDLSPTAISDLCITPVITLPDQPFFDVVSDLIRCLDDVYFNEKGLAAPDLLRIRTELAKRLEQTRNWKRLVDRPGYGVEVHLGPALASMFMSYRVWNDPPQCYVTALGISRAAPFIPLLADLAVKAPSLYVVMLALSVGMVSGDHPYLTLGVRAVQTCMKHFPDDTMFWIDYGVGKKFCDWVGPVVRKHGVTYLDKESVRGAVESILSDLIRLGVAEATPLEAEVLEASSA